MKDVYDNNLIRFINLSRKKEGLFANFKVKGIKGGVSFTASLSVDIAAADVHPGDPLEKIVEACAARAVREFKKTEMQFEGIAAAL